MDNNNNLLTNYGISACPAVREITLPLPSKIRISDDKELCLVSCGSQMEERVNILSKTPHLETYKDFIREVCGNANFFLCERSIKLAEYISCRKIDYGFYYKFRTQMYKTDAFSSSLTGETDFLGEIDKIIREQKKLLPEDNLESWLLYEAKTICAVKEGKLAGFIVLFQYYGQFVINSIYVQEQFRGGGVGTELLKYASNFVCLNGCGHFWGMSPYRAKHFYSALDIESSAGWILWKKTA